VQVSAAAGDKCHHARSRRALPHAVGRRQEPLLPAACHAGFGMYPCHLPAPVPHPRSGTRPETDHTHIKLPSFCIGACFNLTSCQVLLQKPCPSVETGTSLRGHSEFEILTGGNLESPLCSRKRKALLVLRLNHRSLLSFIVN
jgi:hypothetical protein